MLFCSQQYLIFFCLIFCIYWSLPWQRLRVWLLLSASFYFYSCWNPRLALLIACSSTLDYLLGQMLQTAGPRCRRCLLGVNLLVNLGLLAFFKYVNFFLESLQTTLQAAGAEVSLPLLNVILPIGISFYTFEAINYVVDVYCGRVKAEDNLANFLLFITFFPHLVAGPIVRARDFLPQIRQTKRWSWARAQLGIGYLFMGLFKKFAVADRMAFVSDPVFLNPEVYATGALWLATLAYALRIYCDFSGYSDMALGSAHLLGYKLARNFNMPYLATNIADFWHRWHISLSTWLRDYLFIPLGGSRGGTWNTFRNLMITMTLGGLWHGASWNFVLWGVVHGLLLAAHRLFRYLCAPLPLVTRVLRSAPGTVARIALTFLCVSLCWILFRAQSLELALTMLQRMLTPSLGWGFPLGSLTLWITVAVLVLCHGVAAVGLWKRMSLRLPPAVLGLGYVAVLLLALVLAPDANKAFIYFQF